MLLTLSFKFAVVSSIYAPRTLLVLAKGMFPAAIIISASTCQLRDLMLCLGRVEDGTKERRENFISFVWKRRENGGKNWHQGTHKRFSPHIGEKRAIVLILVHPRNNFFNQNSEMQKSNIALYYAFSPSIKKIERVFFLFLLLSNSPKLNIFSFG